MLNQLLQTIGAMADARGAQVMLAGGAVRDQLLGLAPLDWDLVVAGDSIALARAFADAQDGAFYVMDAERGVARVLIQGDPSQRVFDFVARRGDSWLEDLGERDFTINAIARSLVDGMLYDPYGGADDLRARLLRAVGPGSILSDPVRAIRGVRLTFQFALTIDPDTHAQMRAAAGFLDLPSAERLRDALFAALELPNASGALQTLAQLGQLTPWLGPDSASGLSPGMQRALGALDGEIPALCAGMPHVIQDHVSEHLRICVSDGRSRRALLRAAVLFHTPTATIQARKFVYGESKLRLSANELSTIRNTIAASQIALGEFAVTESSNKLQIHSLMLAADTAAPEAILAAAARAAADSAAPSPARAAALLSAYFDRYAPNVAPRPLLTGRDLLDIGLRPGPEIGSLLAALREAQMTDQISTRDDALTFVHTEAQARRSRLSRS